MDRTPPPWDEAWYLSGSLRMYDALTDGGVASYAREFFGVLGNKAPLITALPAPVYLLFGRHSRYAPLTNLAAISFGATHAIHCATESECAQCLIFFQVTACTRAQVVSAIVPASTFYHS